MHKYLYFIFITTTLFATELITPIPTNISINHNKAKLGELLFHDPRLSKDNTVSCASCHILNDGGDDNLAVSIGINGQQGTRNAPTVFNARFNSFQFWDGRAKNLEEQATGPIHNPVEMGSTLKEVLIKLKKDSTYNKHFNKIYQDGITEKNIIDAIVEFENTLITPNSTFDKYLRGDKNILTKEEKEGYVLFKEYGCISCHNGINIGGNLMQKMGIIEDFKNRDLGKFIITNKEEDKYYFKVPSLRNITLTSPYFHDGKIKTLKEAINQMSFFQVGYALKNEETDKIIAFLKTLTGEIPILKEDDE